MQCNAGYPACYQPVLMQCIAVSPDAVDYADAMYCTVPCMLPACADAKCCPMPCMLPTCADVLMYCTVPWCCQPVLMQWTALCPDAVDCADVMYCTVPWCCWLCWCNVSHCALMLPACADAMYCTVPCMLPACADATYCAVPWCCWPWAGLA